MLNGAQYQHGFDDKHIISESIALIAQSTASVRAVHHFFADVIAGAPRCSTLSFKLLRLLSPWHNMQLRRAALASLDCVQNTLQNQGQAQSVKTEKINAMREQIKVIKSQFLLHYFLFKATLPSGYSSSIQQNPALQPYHAFLYCMAVLTFFPVYKTFLQFTGASTRIQRSSLLTRR